MRSAGAFSEYFGVGPGPGRVLAYLNGLGGKPATSQRIGDALGYSAGSVRVFVVRLRDAMDAEAIDSAPIEPRLRGRSGRMPVEYYLTDLGMAECAKAFEDARGRRP